MYLGEEEKEKNLFYYSFIYFDIFKNEEKTAIVGEGGVHPNSMSK